MYVTSATGLGIYDITTPESPQLLSRLPLPHFENEDVDVGRDTVVITNDPSFSSVGVIYLIDVSDPARRPIRSTLLDTTGRAATPATGTSRTASNDCHYLYTTGTCRGPGDLRHPRPRQPAAS